MSISLQAEYLTGAYSGMTQVPRRLLVQLNAVCVLVSRQIGNVGLLDGGGKMTEGGQGRG